MGFEKNASDINKVIDELSRIDKAAEGYATSLEDQKANLLSEYQQKRAELQTAFREQGIKRNEEYRARLKAENDAQIAALRKDSEEYLAALDSAFEKHHSEWAREIMQTIISEQ